MRRLRRPKIKIIGTRRRAPKRKSLIEDDEDERQDPMDIDIGQPKKETRKETTHRREL